MSRSLLPLPGFFEANKKTAGQLRIVPYADIEDAALKYAKENQILHCSKNKCKVCVIPIDMQITFCMPGAELFVSGRSGRGALDDCIRLAEFGYRYLDVITEWVPTLDTHLVYQIFSPLFWINNKGEHPTKNVTQISYDDVKMGYWKVNPTVAGIVAKGDVGWLQNYVLHYLEVLAKNGRGNLQIWTYHAPLGGVSQALMPLIDEMTFFHSVARGAERLFQVKGNNPLTEHYSVFKPEVLTTQDGEFIANKNASLVKKIADSDIVIICGEAGDFCFSWSVSDLLDELLSTYSESVRKIYLLEDAVSPVVIPEVYDGTDSMNAALRRFKEVGVHLVKTTDPIETWPDIASHGLKMD